MRIIAKVLYINGPAHGHINPTLGLVEELVRRGEKVVYFTTEEFRDKIQKKGAEVRTYRKINTSQNFEKHGSIFNLAADVSSTAKKIIPDILDKIKGEKFDYVIHDAMFGAGKQISEILGVPSICGCAAFGPSETVKRILSGSKFNMFKTLIKGIPGLIEFKKNSKYLEKIYNIKYPGVFQTIFNKGDLNIIFTSEYFQPDSDALDQSFKFVGPIITDRAELPDFPFESLKGHNVIFISMGTVFNNTLDFYKKCFVAFKDENVKVVLSVGSIIPITAIGEIPKNFIVRKYVPQLELLKYVNIFITHGGMNSVSEGLYNNIPLIVIPQFADQPAVAARVKELGAGVILNKENINPEILRQAVQEIFRYPSFAENSKKIGHSLRNAGGKKKAVDEILAFRDNKCMGMSQAISIKLNE